MKRLHLECLPDEFLVKKLGYARKEILHHDDKGRVCNSLQKQSEAVGMIDEDPGSAQPTYLRSLKEISYEHNVKLLQDDKTGNKVVVLCPQLEGWIIEVCKLNKVDINDFGLSDSGNALHREINGKLNNLDKLLTYLIELKAPQLKRLKELLKA